MDFFLVISRRDSTILRNRIRDNAYKMKAYDTSYSLRPKSTNFNEYLKSYESKKFYPIVLV